MADTTIKIDLIDIPSGRLRDIDQDWANCLAAMFVEVGQKSPIDVVASGKRFQLVAGGHRLAAAKIANWKEIDARVLEPEGEQVAEDLRLHEILENLGRKDFSALERCEALAEMKRIYEALHPKAKNGGDRKSQAVKNNDKNQNAIFAFCSSASDTTGLSRRSVELAVQIFTSLSPETRERLKGTPYAAKQSDLKALAALDVKTQAKVLALILGDRPEVSSIADAVLKISGQKPVSDTVKRQNTVTQYLPGLGKPFRATLFRGFKEEIVELVKKEGWLDG